MDPSLLQMLFDEGVGMYLCLLNDNCTDLVIVFVLSSIRRFKHADVMYSGDGLPQYPRLLSIFRVNKYKSGLVGSFLGQQPTSRIANLTVNCTSKLYVI